MLLLADGGHLDQGAATGTDEENGFELFVCNYSLERFTVDKAIQHSAPKQGLFAAGDLRKKSRLTIGHQPKKNPRPRRVRMKMNSSLR